MHNNLMRQRKELPQLWKSNSNNTFGEDSFEISPNIKDSILEEEEEEEDDDDDEMFQQSDLAERIMAAEKKFSTSSIHTSYFSSEYFEHPALYRVLFMGSITEESKKELFKKLSQGFVHVLQQQQDLKTKNLSLLGQPIIPFKEIKHNVLLLDDEELISDTCEDIGVSMIEADFTWNSNAVNYSNDANNLLLQYAWHQCPNPRELPSAWLENQIFKNSTKFTGYMYPERTPNGIDLCVYFYDGPIDENRTKNDLELLCLLRKLGIYVLPLTTSRDESIKSHFANLLTEYKVRCLDLGNLEVGQEPSFFHKPIDRIARLKGIECTQSNVPRVATYQILAVDQFCGIENKAIFQLLKRTRERQVIRDELKEELQRTAAAAAASTTSSLEIIESSVDSYVKDNTSNRSTYYSYGKSFIILLFSIIPLYFSYKYFIYQRQQQLQQSYWTVSFNVDSNFIFTLNTRDSNGLLKWSNTIPLVWLNQEYSIPIEKVDDKPGYYQLLFDPFSTVITENPFISLVFTVNNSIIDGGGGNSVFYTTTTTTYLILNNNYNQSVTTTTTDIHNKHIPSTANTKHNYNNSNVFKRTWRAFIFISNNYSNLYKIIIKK